MKLTPAQRHVMRFLQEDTGSIITHSISPTGRSCMRILSSTKDPRYVARTGVIGRLYMKGALIKEDNVFKINPSQIKKVKNGNIKKSRSTKREQHNEQNS